MRGTLRHFIAKMTFFNVDEAHAVGEYDTGIRCAGGASWIVLSERVPHPPNSNSHHFFDAFRYTETTHTLTQGAAHSAVYPAQHPSGIGARGSYPKVTYHVSCS